MSNVELFQRLVEQGVDETTARCQADFWKLVLDYQETKYIKLPFRFRLIFRRSGTLVTTPWRYEGWYRA